MKSIFKIIYEFCFFAILGFFVKFLRESYLFYYIVGDIFYNSIYVLSMFFIFCFVIVYVIFSVIGKVFFFENHGSKLDCSKIDIDKYKKEM